MLLWKRPHISAFFDVTVILTLQMGYGSRALELLQRYYEQKIVNLNEEHKVSDEVERLDEEDIGLLTEKICK